MVLSPGFIFAQNGEITPDEKAQAMEFFIQGITDFENEDYERALDHLTAAHLKLSDDAGINYALSDVYKVMGDFSNAAYYAQLATNAEPQNKWYHLQLADIYRRTGRAGATLQALENALEHQPADVDILFLKAETYIEFGELLKSNEVLDRILELRGSDFELHLRKFQNYNALQMRDSALAELEKMREINPGNLSTLHVISRYYLELGDADAARETLADALERNPRDLQTRILVAELYIRNKEWKNLGESFVSMLEDPLIYPTQKTELVRFIYLQYQNNPEEVILAEQTKLVIETFSRSEPEYGPAQLIAAEFFLQKNELGPALETLERVNEILPEESEAWSQRMQVLFSLQRYDDAISLSSQAEENAPDNAFVRFFAGASYMLTGRPQEAAEWFEKAVIAPARRNFRSVIYGAMGDVKQDMDLWDEAVEAYETAIRLDRNNHTAKNNYAYYLSLRKERLDYALELSQQAVTAEPGNAAYLDTFGWIYYKMGNYEEALRYIRQSVDTGEASAAVYEHLGDVYQALEDVESAQEWWQKALEKDPEREYLKERIR